MDYYDDNAWSPAPSMSLTAQHLRLRRQLRVIGAASAADLPASPRSVALRYGGLRDADPMAQGASLHGGSRQPSMQPSMAPSMGPGMHDRWGRARVADQAAWEQQQDRAHQEWLLEQGARQREFELQLAQEQEQWEQQRQLQQALWDRWQQRQRAEWEARRAAVLASQAQQAQQAQQAKRKRQQADEEAESSQAAPQHRRQQQQEEAATAPCHEAPPSIAGASLAGHGTAIAVKPEPVTAIPGPESLGGAAQAGQPGWDVPQPSSPPPQPEHNLWPKQSGSPGQIDPPGEGSGASGADVAAGTQQAQQAQPAWDPKRRRSAARAQLLAKQQEWCEAARQLLAQLKRPERLSGEQVQAWKVQQQWLMTQLQSCGVTPPPQPPRHQQGADGAALATGDAPGAGPVKGATAAAAAMELAAAVEPLEDPLALLGPLPGEDTWSPLPQPSPAVEPGMLGLGGGANEWWLNSFAPL